VRAVGPPDSPFEGMLARAPDGGTVLLVDRKTLGEWPGWRMPAGTHVLAPLDVLRRPDGHDLVLPALADRLDRLLIRRRSAGAPVSDGESVTVAVSVLRGLVAALAEDLEGATASWWVTPEGMPVLVCGTGDGDAARASKAIVELLVDDARSASLRDVLAEGLDGVSEVRMLPRNAEGCEDRLFAAAQPEPLMTEVIGPVRARAAAPVEPIAPESEEPRRTWWSGLAFAADAGLAEAASDVLHRTRARVKGRGGRARPVVWAGGLAAVVLAVGLSWPDASEPSAAAGSEVVPATPTPARSPLPTDDGTSVVADEPPDDAGEALRMLLAGRASCADAECRSGSQEDAGKTLPAGAIDAAEPTISLLDDFGGLAVLRVDAAEAPSQLVTVVTTPEGWRIRDVFEVADPPS
jgi:hypothetical protein